MRGLLELLLRFEEYAGFLFNVKSPLRVVRLFLVVVFLFVLDPRNLRIFAPHALAALDPFFNNLLTKSKYFTLFSFFAYFLSLLVKRTVAGHTDGFILLIFYVCSMASTGTRHELIKLCLIL